MGIRSREQTWPPKTFYLPRQKRLPYRLNRPPVDPTRGSARQRISSIKA
jgi:hypothetical protein